MSRDDETNAVQDDPWAEAAEGWDDDTAVITYAKAAWQSLRSAVPLGTQTRVLDFGCGTGLLTERLAPLVREVVAVDASPAMIDVLATKQLPNVRAGVARWTPETIAQDELAEQPFDLVVCSSVCAFLDDYPGTLAMLAERMVPGGHFVQWDWEFDPDADESFGLTRDAISDAIEAAGLEVISVGIGFEVPFEEHTMRPLMGVGKRPG